MSFYKVATIECGLKLDVRYGCTRIQLQSDSLNASSYLKGAPVQWNAHSMLRRIRDLVGNLEAFEPIKVCYAVLEVKELVWH